MSKEATDERVDKIYWVQFTQNLGFVLRFTQNQDFGGMDMAMRVHDRTKAIFADTLIEMLKEKELADIRVSDICQRCGASRKTFYYHFQDKYDLMQWVLAQYFQPLLGMEKSAVGFRKGVYRGHRNVEQILPLLRKLSSDPHFSGMLEYMIDYTEEAFRPFAESRFDGKALDEKHRYSLRLYIYGATYMFREWLQEGCKVPMEEYVENLMWSMPEWLKEG